MRLLRRNRKPIVIKTLTGTTPILRDGFDTGEVEYVYEEKFIDGTIVPANSKVLTDAFGKINDSRYVIFTYETLNIDDKVNLEEFGEIVTYKVTYRKETIDHNVYGVTSYEN